VQVHPDDLPVVLRVCRTFYDVGLPIACKTIMCSIFDPLQLASVEHKIAKRRLEIALTKFSRNKTIQMVKNLVVIAEEMSLSNDHPLCRHICPVVRQLRREAPSNILKALPRLVNLRSIEYVALSIPL
jgi:hypothetical protein